MSKFQFFTITLSIAAASLILSTTRAAKAAIPPGPFGPQSKLLQPSNTGATSQATTVTVPTAAAPQFTCADMRRVAMRMSTHASNLANRTTTRTPAGGPYKRLEVICKAGAGAFCNVEAMDESKSELMPGHPDADATGMVRMPAINAGSESAGLNTSAIELKLMAAQGVCGTKAIEQGPLMIVKYNSDFDVMMDTMTFSTDGRMARWSRTTRDGRTQNLSFKEDGTPVGL